MTFSEIPLVVVRANTLPKNAPIELEMMAMATKSKHTVECAPGSVTVKSVESDQILYRSARFDTIESLLASDAVIASGRVDVYLAETEKLDEAVMSAIREKCP